ncbi:uncharacterized protein LOC121740198 isoform X3 [Aricia agestis]|uniref:uncharacterized protein LOC121740198 isoform X3 n=1 Tax=Aricia agestis TaxID=91739 RepID=UPI001C20812F|nr:uncharacterized protein LOC121740198 isoform X3 [Aricia agestis]
MDCSAEKEWKTKLGFPINYDSDDDDLDSKDVVMRNPAHSSSYLLEECGDGSEADLLGTTPPRARIRDKEKRRNMLDTGLNVHRALVEGKVLETASSPIVPERLKKRSTLKLRRSKERDWKLGRDRESKADSLPSPSPTASAAVPTLKSFQVESCSRFMSLTSKLKCREQCEEVETRGEEEEAPSSRVNFHNTFSMLINMGNIEKGCRRTISREEQVWQNELKDLIWLELKARISDRTLAQQDAYLCAQREVVPRIVQRILDYKFVNTETCRNRSRQLSVINGSTENVNVDSEEQNIDNGEVLCLSLGCHACSRAVGVAMRQILKLLSAYDGAIELYPSSSAASTDHPELSSPRLNARLRSMCLWYNTVHHMRLKILSVRCMLRTVRNKNRRTLDHLSSTESSVSRKSSVCAPPKPCQVRFQISNNTSDSNNSDTSGHSEGRDDPKEPVDKVTAGTKKSENEPNESDTSQNETDNKNKSEDESESKTDKDTKETEDSEKNSDVVDSGLERQEHPEDSKPDIVVSDAYSTYDTNESGYNSGSEKEVHTDDVFDIGPLTDVTELRLLGQVDVSLFRDYHIDMLKTQGVRRCFLFMNKMRKKLLDCVNLTLQEPEAGDLNEDTYGEEKESAKTDEGREIYEFKRYGCWSEETQSMRLPSYRNHFLLLNCICMEAVHDYLSLRMEGSPEHPSCLTIKQLIHELKEGLDFATEVRAAFAGDVTTALRGVAAPTARPQVRDLQLLLQTFDATVETAVQNYLSYLRKMSETETLSRARLAPELAFAARLSSRVPATSKHADQAFVDIACNQIDRQLKIFNEKFEKVIEKAKGEIDEEEDRYIVYALCREAQDIYMSERESTLQAAQWARVLAARLPQRAHAKRLFESLMALRSTLVRQTEQIFKHSRMPQTLDVTRDPAAALNQRSREMLLQAYKLGFELHMELHRFTYVPRKSGRGRPASLQPPRPTAVPRPRRPGTVVLHESFNPMVHRELQRFINETPASPSFVPKSARNMSARARLMRSESIGEEVEACVRSQLPNDKFNNNSSHHDLALLLTGSQVGLNTINAVLPEQVQKSAEEAEWAKRVARATIEFAKCWMQFVVERCERGRGLRPRWASQGLEFLMLACDPCNTKHLTDEEFEEMKHLMDGCISHVIGSRPLAKEALGSAPTSPAPAHRQRHRLHSPLSSTSKDGHTPTTPPSEVDATHSPKIDYPCNHSKRVMEAIRALDRARDEQLQEAKAVGKVLESKVWSYEPKLRQLTFKWQRGLKIGAGTFGKVYTVVNTASGQVLAMKEISIAAGDRRAVQRAANELRVLEGVLHPHLVRYYGCELHREEMLLFMELCVEGSLEALVATSGPLGEQTTRRYTKQLLSAVQELHSRSIAHRDIKSGNIFLTNEGHCLKLGDFGCAVKIRANTTAPGELQGFVGTQAYMAPEVFMKSSGHGRAADIWSLGCVVTEMASGKRPFSEYDSNYQIMFVVGMGDRPRIPESLSDEGQEFCRLCLTHAPEQRPRAEALSLHHFLMVKSDDECNCQPGYLVT